MVVKTVVIECDKCAKDITFGMGYRLVLTPERLPRKDYTAAEPAILIYPPIDREHQFCGMKCLRAWAAAPDAKKPPQPEGGGGF